MVTTKILSIAMCTITVSLVLTISSIVRISSRGMKRRKCAIGKTVHVRIVARLPSFFLLGQRMSIARARPCPWFKARLHSAPTDKTVGMLRKRTAMHSIIALAALITSFGVPEDCSGTMERRNAAGNRLFVAVHRRKCYLMKTNSIRRFAQERRMGKKG